MGCGKGEMLIRLAEKYNIKGVGVDKSPYCVRDAENQKNNRVPQAELNFVRIDGADYKPETEESQDLTLCIGASWIYGGYEKTIGALSRMTKLSGHVMVGEPFWRKTPPQAYLKQARLSKGSFNTHRGNVNAGETMGLALAYALVSSEADWDKYEGLHWYAAREYAASHPQDPDLKELLARNSRERESYLKYGRDVLGWAIYLFQRTR
ncbi:MAG TPA: class I SAM-dependent methyltransferase [Candidatus Bathyarchaeia archaeon]|nr:class I SAM-dependent methyltransferase [Candidatus Bathyarchaeia archaeon]